MKIFKSRAGQYSLLQRTVTGANILRVMFRLKKDIVDQLILISGLRRSEEEVGKLWNEKKFQETLGPAEGVKRLIRLLLGELSRAYGQSLYNLGRIHRSCGNPRMH